MIFGGRESRDCWQSSFWIQTTNSSTPRVKSGFQNAERENRDLGVIQLDGTALEIKIKELTDAEKHKRQ